MKNNIFLVVISVFLLFCHLGCIKEVTYSTPSANFDQIVISGRITDLGERQSLRIMRPGDYKFQNFAPITGARVTLQDNQGGIWYYQEEFRPDTIHTYYLDGFTGIPGREYSINIKLTNGAEYESEPQIMPVSIPLDSIYCIGEMEEKVTPTGVFTTTPTAATYGRTTLPQVLDPNLALHWDINGVWLFNEYQPQIFPPDQILFCFIKDYFNRQNINVLRLEDVVPGTTLEQRIGRTNISYAMEVKMAFIVTQFTTTKKTAEYLERVKNLIEPTGSIFDVPPGNVPGNIYLKQDRDQRVLGYFEVASAQVKRTFIVNGQLGQAYGFYNSFCYPNDNNFTSNTYTNCFNCLTIPGSSGVVPPWWQ
jgi:hypothetical protein